VRQRQAQHPSLCLYWFEVKPEMSSSASTLYLAALYSYISWDFSHKMFSKASTLYFVACRTRGPYTPTRLIVFPANMPASFSPHTTVQDKENN